MDEKRKENMLTVIYVLTVLSAALLVAAIIVLCVGAFKEPERGERGLSAYDAAVNQGFYGSEEEWLDSLKGQKGEQGERGEKGAEGEQGEQGVGVKQINQKRDKWGIKTWFEIVYSDESTSDTENTPMLMVDPAKSYQAETEEERSLLLSYGVRADKIFSAAEIGAQIGQGGTIEAQTDLTLSAHTALSKDAALKLGGHTLTIEGNSSFSVAEGTSLTVEGGTIASDADDAIASQRAVFLVGKEASLTLNGVLYDGNGPLVCPMENSSVTIMDSEITTSGYYALSTNATYGDHMTVRIENSALSALRESGDTADGDSTAVLVNVPCTLSVKKSVLKGSRQALVVRCGNAEIEDSTLEVTGAYPDRDKYFSEPWSQGNEVPMGGLVIGNRSYAAYLSPASVSLKKTEVRAPSGVCSVYLYGNDTEDAGASFTFDGESNVGTYRVGGGYVTVNGEKQEAASEPHILPFFPGFPRIRRKI